MERELFDYVAERVDVLASSDLSTQVTKDAAQAWKDATANGADDSTIEAATTELLDTLEGRPTTIDGLIAFLEGPSVQIYGEEATAQMLADQQQRKATGELWCNCEACAAASEILAKFGRVELSSAE